MQLERNAAQNAAGQVRARRTFRLPQWAITTAVVVLAGMSLHRYIPAPYAAAAGAALAAFAAVSGMCRTEGLRLRAHREPEPPWVQEMTAYREWLPRRVPALAPGTMAAVGRHLGPVPAGGRWRSAHLMIARHGQGLLGPFAKTAPLGDRFEVMLGEHIAESPAPVVAAVLAHEKRHMSRARIILWDLATSLRAPGFILAAAWALPLPAALAAVPALRIAAMLLFWSVEVSCDLGAAADEGPAAMTDVYAIMTACEAARKTASPRPGQVMFSIRRWAALSRPHPPIPVRRAITRMCCRTSA
jgi:hypothetical protein